MNMHLYWYRWTGQSGQTKLEYTTYESGKSTTYHIVFDPSFPETPALVYGLNHLDSTEYENVRITTAVNCLGKTAFNLTIQSWKSTLTYDAWVQWMAFTKWCWLVIHSWCRGTQLYRIIYKGLLLEMYSLIHPHNQERFEETKGVIRRVNHRTVNTMSR
jgi:hypothetical protein